MFRFAAILLTMLGLALGSTSNLVSAAPLCAAPGETTCNCGRATSGACCHTTTHHTAVQSCCSATEGSCCQQSSEQGLAGETCDGCTCCYEPFETPLVPAAESEMHLPIDLLVWTSPIVVDNSATAGLTQQSRIDLSSTGVSLQVLHCRWSN